MRDYWHSILSDDAPAKLAASGCAPPYRPSLVKKPATAQVATIMLATRYHKGS
jgi:hypothetical protein